MHLNKISFIGTTIGGRDEFILRLFNSLLGFNNQIEVIFVDQTPEKSVTSLLSKFKNLIDYKVIETQKCSLSVARNLGLRYATGNIIAFCDDDAFYDFNSIKNILAKGYNKKLLVCPVYDYFTNQYYSNRAYPKRFTKLNYGKVTRFALSVGVFIYLDKMKLDSISFNERLGVGSPIGGSEETFLFLSLLENGYSALYEPELRVYHDNDNHSGGSDELMALKYENYAVGYGYVIRYYIYSSPISLTYEFLSISIRCILGIIFKKNKYLYLYRLRGILNGFFNTGSYQK